MNTNPARPRTPEEIDAGIAKIFANIVPTDVHQPSLRELLEPYRAHLAAKHKQGYSFKQISEALQLEPFSIKVSAVTLLKFLRGKSKKHPAGLKPAPVLKPIIPLDAPVAPATVKPANPAPTFGAKPSLPIRPPAR